MDGYIDAWMKNGCEAVLFALPFLWIYISVCPFLHVRCFRRGKAGGLAGWVAGGLARWLAGWLGGWLAGGLAGSRKWTSKNVSCRVAVVRLAFSRFV